MSPDDSEAKEYEAAVRSYWAVRESQQQRQIDLGRTDAGSRGAVTGGAHLNGIRSLLRDVFLAAGFAEESIKFDSSLHLPGYYRPTKNWDLLVVDDTRLVAAIELKSQVGPSFGNNFNNRIEEGLGNATDLWRAYEEGTFGPVRPWIGYVFLLEDAKGSTKPVRLNTTHFPVEPVFRGTSYADRYGLFCKRLVRERLYDAAWFVMSSSDPLSPVREPDPELSFNNFVAAVKGRATYLNSLPTD